MTKRTLDADALLEWIKSINKQDFEIFMINANTFIDKINELATADTPPVEQEDWQVGDVLECAFKKLYASITEWGRHFYEARYFHDSHLYIRIYKGDRSPWKNITAALRLKSRKIAILEHIIIGNQGGVAELQKKLDLILKEGVENIINSVKHHNVMGLVMALSGAAGDVKEIKSADLKRMRRPSSGNKK